MKPVACADATIVVAEDRQSVRITVSGTMPIERRRRVLAVIHALSRLMASLPARLEGLVSMEYSAGHRNGQVSVVMHLNQCVIAGWGVIEDLARSAAVEEPASLKLAEAGVDAWTMLDAIMFGLQAYNSNVAETVQNGAWTAKACKVSPALLGGWHVLKADMHHRSTSEIQRSSSPFNTSLAKTI
jgi:hypothetical protein